MYYPTTIQPTSTGIWPNGYQINTQQQQPVPTVYYQVPSIHAPSFPTATSSEAIVQQQQPQATSSTTIIKSTTTRVLDTTAVTKPDVPVGSTIVTSTATSGPPVTTTTVVPTVEMTTIREPSRYRPHRRRIFSTPTSSDDSTTSSNSTIPPQPEIIKQETILPPQIPIQTTTIGPARRVIHQPYRSPRTPSGYYSSDLDYGKRRVYKTDYKYRHYYCCNWCKGRCDLRNRSYGCCEWFYGCPIWAFIFLGLLFLALLVAFLTLLGLQPSINASRYAQTAETRLLNRTQIVYGFYQNCGYQVNATNVPTTLILCTNTATTTTARVQLSPFYTILSGTNRCSFNEIVIWLFIYLNLILTFN
jgi:hypothetical protein